MLYHFLNDGVLCVGGRLAYGKSNDEAKYQRLVSLRSNLAALVSLNLTMLHLMLGQIIFWIVSEINIGFPVVET